MRSCRFKTVALAGLAGLSALACRAQPGEALDAAVYAGRDIQVNHITHILGGPIVAGGDLRQDGSLTGDAIYLGGSYRSTGYENYTGGLTAVGDVTGLGWAGAFIGGSVFSGGGVTADGIDIAGDITASGNVSQTFSLTTISGNITSGGFVTVEGTVGDPVGMTNGVITHATGFSLGTFASVNDVVQGGPVAPPVFNTPTLPAPHTIVPGSTDIMLTTFQDRALDPGTYGTLTFASGNTVTLSAGKYVFDDIVSDSGLNRLAFDTTNGPITVLIAGDFSFDQLVQVINGEALFAGGNPDPADAADILFESSGSFTVGADLYGTVYAPNGDITLDPLVDLHGSLIAGRDVVFTGSADITYVRSAVPEPAAGGLLALGLLSMARRRRPHGPTGPMPVA